MSMPIFDDAAIVDFSYLLDTSSDDATQQRHADFDVRAEFLTPTEDAHNETVSEHRCIKLDVIESTQRLDSAVRVTAILKTPPGSQFHFGNYRCGHEILVLDGELLATTESTRYKASCGQYLRIPYGEQARFSSPLGCRYLFKIGQMSDTDHEPRLICTDDKELWLPGPTDGTEVLPLHLHDTKNILLIRWNSPAYFKPQLDPLGEEIFVVDGTLHDAYGSYKKGSWIRNPIPAWQSWGGHAGTLVYYKNGHFPVL